MSGPHLLTRREALVMAAASTIAPHSLLAEEQVMHTRRIPASGEELPLIGLGTYNVFDVEGTPEEIATRLDIVNALLDNGGKVIDTSPMYNRSETIIGDVLASGGIRGRCFLATKIWTDGRAAGERQLRRSAELMRTPVIDLVQVHNLRDVDAHWPTVREQQADGTVRYNGVTDYRESALAALETVMKEHKPQFVQINYSLGERAADERILPLARDLGIAVLTNRPFVAGRLFRAVGDRPLPAWAREFAATWGQFFLKFIVSHPAVTCAIPATRRLSHMLDNAAAGQGPLPDEATRLRMIDYVESL